MTKQYLTLLPLGLAAAGSCMAATEKNPLPGERPNIVLIYADDIGYGDLACYGYGKVATPNVDAVAASGIRFTDAHCSSATSTPSRFSMLTGKYAWRQKGTGVAPGDAAMIIKPEQYTLADMFTQAGYNTAALGKWHLGLGAVRGEQDWNKLITPNLSDIGFKYSYIMAATGDRVPCIFIKNGLGVNLDPNDPVQVNYKQNFPGEPSGKENPELLRMHPSVGHNQAIVHGIPRIGFMKGGEKARWIDEDIADVLADQAVTYIEEQAKAKTPFFLYLATNDIHVPRVPHQRFIGKSGMGPRGDALLSFDWTVGQVVAKIKELGIEDNTIIMISSDNGAVIDDGYKDQAKELLGDHKPSGNLSGGKYSHFEGGTRIPCMISWPGKIQPGTSNALMSQMDWLASFATLLEVEIPEGAAQDSESHMAAWLSADKAGREYLVENAGSKYGLRTSEWKLTEMPAPQPKADKKAAAKKGNKKVKVEPKGPIFKLYNLKSDITEGKDVSAENEAILKQMKEKLEAIKGDEVGL